MSSPPATSDKHKSFLGNWLDHSLEKAELGPACVAMLEIALERAAASMGLSYMEDFAAHAVKSVKARHNRTTGK